MRSILLLLVATADGALPPNATKAQYLAEIARLEGLNATCNTSLATCNTAATASAATIADLQADLAESESDYAACGVQVAALVAENASLLAQLNAAQTNVAKVAFADAYHALGLTPSFDTMNEAYFAAYPDVGP